MTFILENTYQLLLLVGIIFVLVGSIQYTFPPKKINQLYGYRTPTSMKNIEQWHFAQQFSSVRLMQLGGVMIVMSFSKMVLQSGSEMVVSLLVLFASVFFLFFSTEKAIRNKFPTHVD